LQLAVGAAALPAVPRLSWAQAYPSRPVRIVVGFPPGGGADVYSRLIARHLGRFIPGNPTLAVANMPGAGSIIAGNQVFNTSARDGSEIGMLNGAVILEQLFANPGIHFDMAKFRYLAVPVNETYVMIVTRQSGIGKFSEIIGNNAKHITLGAIPNSTLEHAPILLREALNANIKVVSGYKGSSVIRLAFNSGEVDGVANAWESMVSTWPQETQNGDAVVLLQAAGKRHADLPNVPLVIDYAKTDMAKKLVQGVINNFGATARPYVVTPGTPKARVEVLRKAFMDTMKDPEFAAELKKAKLDLNPLDGATLEHNIQELFALDQSLIPKLSEILK
jgi:tripartite-type tricarboxylate transporter receptor subunit TctC